MKHPVDTSQWGEFKLDDLFEFIGSKQVKSQHNLIETDKENGIPFVVQSNQNNMVKCYVTKESLTSNDENIYDGNVLVLGVVTPVASYQAEDFGASQSIILKSDKLNPLRGQFLVSVIRSVIETKYNYSNIPGIQKYKQDVIPLPLKPSADPSNYNSTDIDWDYMETVMSRVTTRAKDRLASLPQPTDKKKTPVDTSSWGEFVVGELFDVHPTKAYKLKNSELLTTSGKNPVVVNSSYNNGIGGYTDQELTESGGILTFSDTTSGADTLFFQEKPFVGYPHVQGMYPKAFQLTTNVAKFMIASLRASINKYSWNYTNKLTRTFISSTTVKLPLKASANPSNYTQDDIDWDYMENFMKTIEEKAHDRLKTLQKTIA